MIIQVMPYPTVDISPPTELLPHTQTFTEVSTTTTFVNMPAALQTHDEQFVGDTGQFSYATEGTLGTVTIGSGQMSIAHTGNRNTIVRTGADWDGRPLWVEAQVVSRTNNASGYNNAGVGIAKDANNFIYASIDAKLGVLRVQAKIGGSNSFLGSTTGGTSMPTTGFKLAMSISIHQVQVFIDNGSGWQELARSSILSKIDTRSMTLTGWKPSITVATDTAQTWVWDNLKAGSYGGVCARDMTLVTNEDGSPVDYAGKVRFSATTSDRYGSGWLVFFEYDPATYAIEQVGALMVSRSGVRQPDLNAHLIKNADSTWRLLMATWGDGFGGTLRILHKNDVGDVSSGFNVISGMSTLALPLPTGTLPGAYDAMAVKDGANWLIGYAVVEDTDFSPEAFYIAAATTSDWSTFTLVDMDAGYSTVEGAKIFKANGQAYITGGGRGDHPVYNSAMAYLGDPTYSPALYNGTLTQPHQMIFPVGDYWHCLTWDATRKGQIAFNFTWGNMDVYRAPRY